jgi:hypothetical protein
MDEQHDFALRMGVTPAQMRENCLDQMLQAARWAIRYERRPSTMAWPASRWRTHVARALVTLRDLRDREAAQS